MNFKLSIQCLPIHTHTCLHNAYILYLASACRSGAWSPAAGLSGAAPRNHRPPSLLGWPSAPTTDSSLPPADEGSSWHRPCIVPAPVAGGAAGSLCLSTPKSCTERHMEQQRGWNGLNPLFEYCTGDEGDSTRSVQGILHRS